MKIGITLIITGLILAVLFIMMILTEINEGPGPNMFSWILLIVGGIAPIAVGGWRIRRTQNKRILDQ